MTLRTKSAGYSGFHGGWTVDGFDPNGGWRAAIRSLDLTEKQKQAASLVLGFVQAGERTGVDAKELAEHFHESVKQNRAPSYRYMWYAVTWLVQNGWLEESRGKSVGGRLTRTFKLSDNILTYLRGLESCVIEMQNLVPSGVRE